MCSLSLLGDFLASASPLLSTVDISRKHHVTSIQLSTLYLSLIEAGLSYDILDYGSVTRRRRKKKKEFELLADWTVVKLVQHQG